MKKILIIIITMILSMALVKTVNMLSFDAAYLFYPSFAQFDPDNVFIVLTIHHICQAVIALLIICVVSRILKLSMREFGFNLEQFKFSLKAVLIFVGIWSVIQAGVGLMMITVFKAPASFGFPLNTRNYIGYFLFEILLSGTSEEIMFRALVISLMIYVWKNLFKKESHLTLMVILSSSLVFMFDHINFSFSPFRITYINLLQQLTALIFGTFYGYLFTRTKSIAGPMLAHNLLNGVIAIIGLVFALTLG